VKIFAAEDPLVLHGVYDEEGYTPKERKAQMRKAAKAQKEAEKEKADAQS